MLLLKYFNPREDSKLQMRIVTIKVSSSVDYMEKLSTFVNIISVQCAMISNLCTVFSVIVN